MPQKLAEANKKCESPCIFQNARGTIPKAGMRLKRKQIILCILTLFLTLTNSTIVTADELENTASTEIEMENEAAIDSQETTEISEEVNEITDKLETVLDPENNELEEKANEVLEKHSDNWFVKIFKTIIDAISHFISAVLELASEAAKIGVD